jgi:hypothetical protein
MHNPKDPQDLSNHEEDELGPADQDLADQTQGYAAPIGFDDRTQTCPNCHRRIDADLDSCPYCGDILFRHLRDGMFIPRKGPLARLVAALIVFVILLGILAFLLLVFLR